MLSDLNYEVLDQNNMKKIVHVNRLKNAYNPKTWRPKVKRRHAKGAPKTSRAPIIEQNEDEVEVKLGPYPLFSSSQPEGNSELTTPSDPIMDTPETVRTPVDIPDSERNDPNYDPPRHLGLGANSRPPEQTPPSLAREQETCHRNRQQTSNAT